LSELSADHPCIFSRETTIMMIRLAESGCMPDRLLRFGMRRLLQKRLEEEYRKGDPEMSKLHLLEQLQQGSMVVDQDAANEQHYEVPAAFYQLLLGPQLKYSSGYWARGVIDLAAAEEAMLSLT